MPNAARHITPASDNRQAVINDLACSIADGEPATIGIWIVTVLEQGWSTKLVFTHLKDGSTHSTTIDSDGPTHAAEKVYRWWTKDAWYI